MPIDWSKVKPGTPVIVSLGGKFQGVSPLGNPSVKLDSGGTLNFKPDEVALAPTQADADALMQDVGNIEATRSDGEGTP